MFSFTYTLDDNDYYDFNKFHMYHAPMNRKRVQYGRFLWPVTYMALAALFFRLTHNVTSYYIYGAISVCWLLFYKQMNNFLLKRRLLKIKKSGKLPYEPQVTMDFSQDQITEKTSTSEAKSDYSQIEHVFTGDSAVYVYKSAFSAYIIPNRVFRDADEKKSFIDFMESKIVQGGKATP